VDGKTWAALAMFAMICLTIIAVTYIVVHR
jgi:hypothetical protein